MSGHKDEAPALTGSWPVQDIIYMSMIGPVLLAAFLEWFLWLAAFQYCLLKVYTKADNWSVKVMAVLMIVLFSAFRGIFLPVMVVTLPLPPRITQYFPHQVVSLLQWFAFWTFSVLLILPWLVCVYRLVTNSLGRQKRIKEVLDDTTAPKTVIVMPVYKEEPAVLIKAIDSVVDCDYPAPCIHVFLSYDGGVVDESFLQVIGHLGIPTFLKDYPTSIDVTYKGARITVSRFKHGGKRHCQKLTFRLIDKVYAHYLNHNDNLFVLFIDSDCILDPLCLQNFMYDMELKPGSKRNMLAMTGVITSTTEKNSLITILQDMEYIHGQLFERSVESGCGSVTCLPGALTMLRFSAFRGMAKYYFADKAEQCDDLFDFGKCHLGEDRWLTHLFMIGAKERYQIQMCTSAFCKTEAVQTFRSLLKQRRRWFLGFITNEVCMLTDIRLWVKYPMLCLVRFMQNTIRTTALLFFIMVISIMTTSNKVQNLPVGFIAVSLGLNYLLMFYFGAKLRRFKAWLYPLMFLLNPFFNWLYMVYGIFTAGQRTWGGPRADAAAADTHVTPQEAAELAEEKGDELNVDLETFRSRGETKPQVPLHPSEMVEGQFVAGQHLHGGRYLDNMGDLGQFQLTLPPLLGVNTDRPPSVLYPRYSLDSEGSQGNPIATPRRVESIMGDEDQIKLFLSRCSLTRSNDGDKEAKEVDSEEVLPAESGERGPILRDPVGTRSPSPSISPARLPAEEIRGEGTQSSAVVEPMPSTRNERSPLGRNSPERVQSEDSVQGESRDDSEARTRLAGKKKRKRLTKRQRDPGDIV